MARAAIVNPWREKVQLKSTKYHARVFLWVCHRLKIRDPQKNSLGPGMSTFVLRGNSKKLSLILSHKHLEVPHGWLRIFHVHQEIHLQLLQFPADHIWSIMYRSVGNLRIFVLVHDF